MNKLNKREAEHKVINTRKLWLQAQTSLENEFYSDNPQARVLQGLREWVDDAHEDYCNAIDDLERVDLNRLVLVILLAGLVSIIAIVLLTNVG